MDATTVSALTEALVNILLGCFSVEALAWSAVGVETLINDYRREKREREVADRDKNYREKHVDELSK
jgi:hypothetical protein